MEEKAVLITGSSKGLGEALALKYVRDYYRVIIHGRDEARLTQLKEGIEREKRICEIVTGNITSARTIAKLFKAAKQAKINILINNAGIYPSINFRRMTDDEIKRIIDTNLTAPIILTKRILPIFKERMSGLIININSLAGRQPGYDEPVYCASKHGLSGFAKSIQLEASKHNIRVMDVFLGAIRTDITKSRKDFGKFMSVYEAAEIIFNASKTYNTAVVKEVVIGRRNY